MFLQWKLQFNSNKILVEYGNITWQSDSKLKKGGKKKEFLKVRS